VLREDLICKRLGAKALDHRKSLVGIVKTSRTDCKGGDSTHSTKISKPTVMLSETVFIRQNKLFKSVIQFILITQPGPGFTANRSDDARVESTQIPKGFRRQGPSCAKGPDAPFLEWSIIEE
jgi:hypothetical protein